MFIITDVSDVVVYKSKTCVEFNGCLMLDNNTLSWSIPGSQYYEVDAIPDGHGIGKSCYTAEKGFYANPDYVEPKTSIDELIAENKMLKAQVQAQTERSDFLEDCLAEMAAQVYNT